MEAERQVFSLKQVVKSIQKTLNDRYASAYWIKAEIHKMNTYPSGHSFPELVYKENGKIEAQLSGAIWKQTMAKITRQFIEVTKEPLKEGSTVLLFGKIVFSETHGISINILDIDPSFTLGELQRERQETLDKLSKEGLLNANQRLNFPLLPKRIAVISAASSKGLSDFYQVLERDPNRYYFVSKLFQAYLQGDVAPKSILNQLDKIEKYQDQFDAVVIVRGGGGEVGMTCYNNFELCKRIAQFPIPILTGIGHSTNMTVAEMVAHENGITPTALAELFVKCFEDFERRVNDFGEDINSSVNRILERTKIDLNHLIEKVPSRVRGNLKEEEYKIAAFFASIKTEQKFILQSKKEHLDRLSSALIAESKSQLTDQKNSLNHTQYVLAKEGMKPIELANEKVREKRLTLERYLPRTMDRFNNQLAQIDKSILNLHPDQVLKRGYSISRLNGKVLDAVNQPKEGDKITTFTFNLELESEIKNIKDK